MFDTWCGRCKRRTPVVFVGWAGYNVCCKCGLILDSHCINATSERRTFSNEFGDNDPNVAALSDRLGLVATIKESGSSMKIEGGQTLPQLK